MTGKRTAILSIVALMSFELVLSSIAGAQANQPLQPHYSLSAANVSRAIARNFPESEAQIDAEQVSLLARVVATDPDPLLDIKSVERFGNGGGDGSVDTHSRFKIKLACHLPGTCLPFYAIVSWTGVGAITGALRVSSHRAEPAAKIRFTIHAGAHATLLMDDDRAHIQIAVISLENGIVGARIKVASPDHKQIYTAEVVSASLLKGTF